jgi:hypothetical protein
MVCSWTSDPIDDLSNGLNLRQSRETPVLTLVSKSRSRGAVPRRRSRVRCGDQLRLPHNHNAPLVLAGRVGVTLCATENKTSPSAKVVCGLSAASLEYAGKALHIARELVRHHNDYDSEHSPAVPTSFADPLRRKLEPPRAHTVRVDGDLPHDLIGQSAN